MFFANRADAGRRLARELIRYQDDRPAVVGLPRGGVPVGYEVAAALAAPLDVLVVRKPPFRARGVPRHDDRLRRGGRGGRRAHRRAT